ncbi:MAG: sigma-70 family RNA polymerase sigma factor [Planctomycetota bacterium]
MTATAFHSVQPVPFNERLRAARYGTSREGKRAALGDLLQLYRKYLQVLAGRRMDARLRRRVGEADLVQETLLAAHRDFGQFRGKSEPEWIAWLRGVLVNCLSHAIEKHVYTQKRDIRREVMIDAMNSYQDEQGLQLSHLIVDRGRTPSEIVESQDLALAMRHKLDELSDRDRDLIVYRNLNGMSFKEIGERMGMRTATTRMAWMRAIGRFREICVQA